MQQLLVNPCATQPSSGSLLSCAYSQSWRPAHDLGFNENEPSDEIFLLLNAEHEDVELEFNRLTEEWKSRKNSTSSPIDLALDPAYQQIIGLGKPAIPLILRELRKEVDHWFWALKAITREDPVPSEIRGKLRSMAACWLEWGRAKGYGR